MNKILNNKILRYVLIAVFTGLIFASVIIGINKFDSFNAFAEQPEIVNADIDDVYARYSSETFPTETTIAYGSQSNLKGIFAGVRLPNGSVFKQTSLDLNDNGNYAVVYNFNYNGKVLTAEKPFTVQPKLYEDFAGASTVSYGALESTNANGLILDLSDGDVFKFNHAINVHEVDLANIITFSPRQLDRHYKVQSGIYDQGSIDCKYIYVTLTDVYDSSKTVEMQLRFSPAHNMSRNFTAAVKSAHGHLAFDEYVPTLTTSWVTYDQVNVNGQDYFIWDNIDLNDSPHRGSSVQDLTGGRFGTSSTNRILSWKYRGAGMEVYCSSPTRDYLIDDIDNADVSPATGVFDGFTTGEVYVSIQGNDYLAPSTIIEIASIGNYSGDELAKAYALDTVAPNVTIDVDMQGADSLIGVVYEPFKVFDAIAFDPNMVGKVDPVVYYNYGTPSQTVVSTQNGVFNPIYAGRYSIVYTASDAFGNVVNKVVPVSIITPPATALGNGIDASYEKLANFVVGNELTVETPDFVSYNGEVICKKYVITPNGTELDVSKDGKFVANMVGEYTVKYVYSDNVYSYESSYKVMSSESTEVFFDGEPYFIKYYIKHATYKLDDFFVYFMQNGKLKSQVATLMVKFDDGDFVETDINNVVITGDETVTFKFVSGSLETAEYTRKIIDVKFKQTHESSGVSLYDVSKYFVGNFDAVLKGQGQRFTSNVESGDNAVEFINPITSSAFNIKLYVPQELKNFSNLKVVLTDATDENNQTELSIFKSAYHTFFRVADYGAKDVTSITSRVINDDVTYNISFNASKSMFILNNQLGDTNVNFKGKLPDKIYVKVVLEGITGPAGVDIYTINGQLFNVTRDNMNPVYDFVSAAGYYSHGSIVTISKAFVTDVLSPVSLKDVGITVKEGSSYVTSEDGVVLNNAPADRDYDICVTSDIYNVNYNGLVDGYGNKMSQSYVIRVSDFQKPTITFNDGSNEDTVIKVGVGTEIEVKQFIVTDNKTDSEKIEVFVFVENSYVNDEANITDTLKYKFNRAGKFKIKVLAKDEAGNIGVAYYTYIVS